MTTLDEQLEELRVAIDGCLWELAKSLGVVALVGWLARKLERRR